MGNWSGEVTLLMSVSPLSLFFSPSARTLSRPSVRSAARSLTPTPPPTRPPAQPHLQHGLVDASVVGVLDQGAVPEFIVFIISWRTDQRATSSTQTHRHIHRTYTAHRHGAQTQHIYTAHRHTSHRHSTQTQHTAQRTPIIAQHRPAQCRSHAAARW